MACLAGGMPYQFVVKPECELPVEDIDPVVSNNKSFL